MTSTIILLTSLVFSAALGEGGDASGRGQIVLVAGGETGGSGAAAKEAVVTNPFGVAFDGANTLYFVEMLGHRVRKLTADGKVVTLAGSGKAGPGGDGGSAVKAEVNGPHSLAVTRDGDIYIADTWNKRVRKIDGRTGLISTVAGTGRKGFSGDGGPATEADFGDIYCLALDENAQTLDLADLDNKRIRRVDLKTGFVSTIAGNGKKGVPEDGSDARTAPLVDPRAVAIDGKGSVYILERAGNALRVVDRSGKIRTVAGTGKTGVSGDGGDARQAKLAGPKHLCVSPSGDVLIADTENHRIRVYHPHEGTITGLAGTGKKGTRGVGGPANQVELNQPHGVNLGPGGVLYISDSSNNRILKLLP
jgi:hypothetical protein